MINWFIGRIDYMAPAKMTPDRRLLSWKFYVMSIQHCLDSTAAAMIERTDLLDKLNFLPLSGTIEKTIETIVSIIQTYRPCTPRRTSGRIVNKKIWRESETYRNFGKRFDWSLAIKRHIVMAAPIVETISLVNGFKRHIIMAALFPSYHAL